MMASDRKPLRGSISDTLAQIGVSASCPFAVPSLYVNSVRLITDGFIVSSGSA